MHHMKVLIVWILVCATVGFAELKIGYVNSDIVLEQFYEAKSADKQLRQEYEKWEREASEKQQRINEMRRNIKRQSLLLSPERLNQLEKELADSVNVYEQYLQQKFGQDGEAARKNAELFTPIVKKINAIIDELAKKENFDFIFDTKDGLVFAKPQYDLTERVIKILNAGK